jgi:hypothetical protein
MKQIVFLLGFALLCPQALLAQQGGELFQSLCTGCHSLSGPPTVAPPAFAMVNHVRSAYPEREDFIQRIVQWVEKPDVKHALMPGAVRRFGLMPAIPGIQDQTALIAGFLYDERLDMPDWYRQHYMQEHGEQPG